MRGDTGNRDVHCHSAPHHLPHTIHASTHTHGPDSIAPSYPPRQHLRTYRRLGVLSPLFRLPPFYRTHKFLDFFHYVICFYVHGHNARHTSITASLSPFAPERLCSVMAESLIFNTHTQHRVHTKLKRKRKRRCQYSTTYPDDDANGIGNIQGILKGQPPPSRTSL